MLKTCMHEDDDSSFFPTIHVPYNKENIPYWDVHDCYFLALEFNFKEEDYSALYKAGYWDTLNTHCKLEVCGIQQGEEDIMSDIDSLKAGKKITQEFQQKLTDEKLKAILQRIEILFDEAIARGTGLYFLM